MPPNSVANFTLNGMPVLDVLGTADAASASFVGLDAMLSDIAGQATIGCRVQSISQA